MVKKITGSAIHSPDPTPIGGSAVASKDPARGSISNGEIILYSEVPGGGRTRSCVEIKSSKKGISEETKKRALDVAEKATLYVQKHLGITTDVSVNFTDLTLLFDGKVMLITDIENPELCRDILTLSKKITSATTTDPSIPSNRPMNGSKPLAIDTKAWYQAHHFPLDQTGEYVRKHHAELDASLRKAIADGKLPAGFADEALPKISAAAHLILRFREELERKRDAKQTILDQIPIDQLDEKQAYRREIEHLDALIDQLNPPNKPPSLDMKAIFRSVPYANKDLDGFTSVAEQMTRAKLAGEEMATHLTSNIALITDGRVFQNSPDNARITAYKYDVESLLINDRWLNKAIIEDRGGEERGASMEEFLVFNILNLKASEEAEFVENALTSLNLPANDEKLRGIVADALMMARTEARGRYDAAADIASAYPDDAQAQINLLFLKEP